MRSTHHRNRVNDGRTVEEELQSDFPEVADVTIFDEQRSQHQTNAQRQQVHFKNVQRQQQDCPTELHSGQQSEHKHHQQVEEQVDERGDRSGKNDDVLGEVDLTDEVATRYDRLQTLRSRFGEEGPERDAGQQVDGIVRNVSTHRQELGEHDVHHREQHERLENRPQVAKRRLLVAQLEIGDRQLMQQHTVPLTEQLQHSSSCNRPEALS